MHRLLLACLVALALLPVAAQADDYTYSPNALVPAQQAKSPSSGMRANSIPVSAASGQFTCNTGWWPVSSAASGYVLGECGTGWVFTRSGLSDPDADGNRWSGGFFQGDYGGCGYIVNTQTALVNGSITDGQCAVGFAYSPSVFAYALNCPPGMCGDGTYVYSTASCPEYANVKPWASTLTPTDYLRTVSGGAAGGAGYGLYWRYVVGSPAWAKRDAAGNAYIMVRDPHYVQGQGNWVFVPASCLPAALPSGPGGTYFTS